MSAQANWMKYNFILRCWDLFIPARRSNFVIESSWDRWQTGARHLHFGFCVDSHFRQTIFAWDWNYSKSSWNVWPNQREAPKLRADTARRTRYRCCHSKATNLTWQHLEPGSSEDLRCLCRLGGGVVGLVAATSGVWPPVKYGSAFPELWRRVAAKVSLQDVGTSSLKCRDFIIL